MKTILRLAYLAILYGLLAITSPADSSAPYFHIAGNHDDTSDERLPLKSSAAKVTIDGTIARVRLSQRYGNNGSVPIEAVYVFPCLHPRGGAWHDPHHRRPGDRLAHPRIRQGEGGISNRQGGEKNRGFVRGTTAECLPDVRGQPAARRRRHRGRRLDGNHSGARFHLRVRFPDRGRPALHRWIRQADMDREPPSEKGHPQSRHALRSKPRWPPRCRSPKSPARAIRWRWISRRRTRRLSESTPARARTRQTAISSSAGNSAAIRWTPDFCSTRARRRIISCCKSNRRNGCTRTGSAPRLCDGAGCLRLDERLPAGHREAAAARPGARA